MASVLLTAAVVPTGLFAATAIVAQSRALTQRLATDLETIADAQLGRLELVERGVELQLAQIASRTVLRDRLAEFDAGDRAARTDIVRILGDAQQATDDLMAIAVFDTAGRLVHSTSEHAPPLDALPPPMAPGEVTTAVIRDDGTVRLIAGRLMEREGVVIGTVVVEPRLATLADLVDGPTGDGKATTCLYHRMSDGAAAVVDISPSGHKVAACGSDGGSPSSTEDALLPELADEVGAAWVIPATASAVPAHAALDGVAGLMLDSVDAQGTRVVAATRYMEPLDWGLTVRVPRDALLAPVRDLAHTMVVAMLAIVVVAVLVAWRVSLRMTRPIIALRDAAMEARTGSPMPAAVRAPGELGELADAFDTMAASVRENQAGLERRYDDLELLTHAMAHDLKAPLGTLHGFFASLAHGRVTDPKQREEVLQRGVAAAERTLRLVDDLVALIRTIDTPLRRTTVDLAALVDDIVDELDADASVERGELPSAAGDPVLLRQVLHNLIDNALRYHAPGTPVRVRVTGHPRDNGAVVVRVDDAGIGIPEDERDDVHYPFVRGGLARRHWPSGTGLGLSIVHRAVALHGGTFGLAASPLGGTRAELSLPPAEGHPVEMSHP